MTNGNGSNNGSQNGSQNGSHRWWRVWKRDKNLDLAAYRRLAIQLHQGLPREGGLPRSVLFVTPNESDYWAEGCITLASCIAEELRRTVLLVDADTRLGMSRILGAEGQHTFTDAMADPSRQLREVALQTSKEDVWFFSAAGSEESPSRVSPECAAQFLLRARESWDFIVVGGGPILRNSLALALAPHVGHILLMVTENKTRLDDITEAQNALDQCNVQNVSLVLSQLDNVGY